MSRLAKKPIKLLEGVTFSEDDDFWVFKGPKGENKVARRKNINVRAEGGVIYVSLSPAYDSKGGAVLGTAWSLCKNAILGVTGGFSQSLIIDGIGYRAVLEGKDLVLYIGYATPVHFSIPERVSVSVEKNTINVSGIDKELVGQTAAKIRAIKKPEPYKGKGIRYQDEVIRRKAGKKAGATATAA